MCLIFSCNTEEKMFSLIALDIFKEVVHNTGIKNELDAWLTFISCDEPERLDKRNAGCCVLCNIPHLYAAVNPSRSWETRRNDLLKNL